MRQEGGDARQGESGSCGPFLLPALEHVPHMRQPESQRAAEVRTKKDKGGQKKAQNISMNITSTKIQPHRVLKIAARREARVGKKETMSINNQIYLVKKMDL